MIHTCIPRKWYVTDYLVPSLLEQGILKENIYIWLDKDKEGCLKSCIKAFTECGKYSGNTWHLQDDILICHDFAKRTQNIKTDLACGFCCDILEKSEIIKGKTTVKHMWESSFPCIKIPNKIAKEFVKWIDDTSKEREDIAKYANTGKWDDILFRIFMLENHSDMEIENIIPHLVEHIDELIGGSIINRWRKFKTYGTFFKDHYLVNELKIKLTKK